MQEISPYIIAAASGWLVAQLAKYIIYSARSRKLAHYRELYKSGRMPSAHSATSVALLTTVGLIEGINSALFGVTLMFTSIILYDAMMVRRSSGEQGIALTALIKERDSKVPLPRVAMGHTPLEVAIGSLVGLAVGFIVVAAL